MTKLSIFLLFTLFSVNSYAAKRCVKYNLISSGIGNNTVTGMAYESGLSIDAQGKRNDKALRCFSNSKSWSEKGTYVSVKYSCQCVEYAGLDEAAFAEDIANRIANKMTIKMNAENSKNIERTVEETYQLHNNLVMSLQNFVQDILAVEDNKKK
jgi:hypothetical protein